METIIRKMFLSKRATEAESQSLHDELRMSQYQSKDQLLARMNAVDQRLVLINTWLHILSEDEKYVICRHLVDGIDWPRINVEYRQRWGEEQGKSERSLKSYQRKAIQKIVRFVESQKEFLPALTEYCEQ